MGMILRIASSRIVGQGDIVGRSGYFSLNLSANSVMRGRLDARRTLKSLVADLRFSAPGISVSDPETTPNLWKQKPVLPGRSFPITKVEFIRVITKQKSAIFPPPGKKSIFQAFTTEKRICCVLICNPMGFLFYWLLSPLFRLTSLVLERSV